MVKNELNWKNRKGEGMVLIESETLRVQLKLKITHHPLFQVQSVHFSLSNKNRASLEIRQTEDLDTPFKGEDR